MTGPFHNVFLFGILVANMDFITLPTHKVAKETLFSAHQANLLIPETDVAN